MWQRVGGPDILPPVYEKKVDRPAKNRRKQLQGVEGKYGPKMSKHGTIITCSYCGDQGHNRGGCSMRKAGSRSKLVAQRNQSQPPQEEYEDEHLTSQVSLNLEEGNQPLLSQMSNTMMSQLDAEVTSVSTY